MRRRDFICGAGFITLLQLRSVTAQELPVVGFMSSRGPADSTRLVNSFLRGLAEAGFIPGQSVKIDFGWAEGDYKKLTSIANEFVQRQIAVLVAVGGAASAQAAKQATASIPVVFSIGPDPVHLGLVKSFNNPATNATGMSLLTTALEAKRLGLVYELVPRSALVVALLNPDNPPSLEQSREIEEAAKASKRSVTILKARNEQELNAAFQEIVRSHTEAVLVAADPFFDTQRNEIVRFAAQQKIPALYQFREYVVAGGLASYGIDVVEAYHQVGIYTARILKGAKPAELPVLQPTKFEFVINLKTARALGLDIPPTLLARADEVIE
jgi:ABC-type uncharacterized transport system substrate-binding protein